MTGLRAFLVQAPYLQIWDPVQCKCMGPELWPYFLFIHRCLEEFVRRPARPYSTKSGPGNR